MDFRAIAANPLCIVSVINMALYKHGDGGGGCCMKRVLLKPFGGAEAWIISLNGVGGNIHF